MSEQSPTLNAAGADAGAGLAMEQLQPLAIGSPAFSLEGHTHQNWLKNCAVPGLFQGTSQSLNSGLMPVSDI